MSPALLGMSIVLLAGAIGSATLLPMKFVRRWDWENTWLLYALLAYFLLPLAVAWTTVPELPRVYAAAGWRTIAVVALYGWGWGLSVVLFGRAVAAVGLAVSNGIILGCSIAVGSLAPLLTFDSGRWMTQQGLRIVACNGVILVGVAGCAVAAYLRDSATGLQDNASTSSGKRPLGLALCVVAGLLTSLINVGLAAGDPITKAAERFGAAPDSAINGVWALALCCGATPSLVWCAWLLTRRRTWDGFRSSGSGWNAGLCLLMAAVFFVSTVAYGMGAKRMGDLGPVYGWPVYISSIIVGNGVWGWLTGEWRLAPKASIRCMLGGILTQVAGILLLFTISGGGEAT